MSLTDLHDQVSSSRAVFLYDDDTESRRLAADYFKSGIENNDLCIFLTSTPKQTIISDFRKYDFDPTSAIDSGRLKLFEMSKAIKNSDFGAAFILHYSINFIRDARQSGYSGIRLVSEMSRPEETKSLKSKMVGLCLYPCEKSFAVGLSDKLNLHPLNIYELNVS
jgi:hypothetical protein